MINAWGIVGLIFEHDEVDPPGFHNKAAVKMVGMALVQIVVWFWVTITNRCITLFSFLWLCPAVMASSSWV